MPRRVEAAVADANDARLGWLIDPLDRMVYVYRPGEAAVRLEAPAELSGEPVLAGFHLRLAMIWQA